MTTTDQRTVGEIAAEAPATVRVFEKYGIDFCCGGKRPLGEACGEKGIALDTVLAELEAVTNGTIADQRDWTTAPLSALIQHIVATHHEYLKNDLPVLMARLDKIATKHADKYPFMVGVRDVFAGLKEELDGHLRKEEMILFPFIEELESADAEGRGSLPCPFGTVDNPIRMMMFEHDNAGTALAEMRRFTNGYTLPEDACNTLRATFHDLQHLESDLHVHIHLENNILFPRARAIESRTR